MSTKSAATSDATRINRIDRDDLFVSTSSKRKRSSHDAQKLIDDQKKKKKKKSLDGEDRQDTLYRRLHKQVRRRASLAETSMSFVRSALLD